MMNDEILMKAIFDELSALRLLMKANLLANIQSHANRADSETWEQVWKLVDSSAEKHIKAEKSVDELRPTYVKGYE